MRHSEDMGSLATALAAAQSEIENATKNATNPHFKNHYADLAEIINTVRPVLNKHGLAVVQLPGYEEGVTTVETILTHKSGEWLSGVAGARVQKDDPQGVGSAITYLRRYSLAAVCGIAQEDDDGEAASRNAPATVFYQNPSKQQSTRTTPEQPKSSEPVGVKHSNAPDLYEQELKFGKHKGRTWGWLIENEPDYVRWACDTMDRIAPEAKEVLRAAIALETVPARAPDTKPLSEPDDDMPF